MKFSRPLFVILLFFSPLFVSAVAVECTTANIEYLSGDDQIRIYDIDTCPDWVDVYTYRWAFFNEYPATTTQVYSGSGTSAPTAVQIDRVDVDDVGVYWYSQYSVDDPAQALFYIPFYYNGSTWGIGDMSISPNITINTPENNSIATSTAINVVLEYDYSGSIDITFEASKYALGVIETISTTTSATVIGTNLTSSFLLDFGATSTWDGIAYMTDFFTGETYFSDPITFHILATSSEYTDKFAGYDDIECSITNLTGCFKKALFWAFIPNKSSIYQFNDLWNDIENKPPFGYVTAVTDNISNIESGTASTTLDLGIPTYIQTTFFDPIRSGLQWLLWLAFLFAFGHRISDLHI